MLLGLDLGTTAVKALAVDPHGLVIARESAPVPIVHLGDGGVEQDIDDIWAAVLAALEALAGKADLGGVRAMGVSSQGGALQVCDGAGRPVGKVISWLDGRGRPYNARLTEELGPDWFGRRTGHRSSGLTIGQLLRLRNEAPGLIGPDSRIAFVGDCVVARLCGRAAHDATSLSLGMLYNPALRRADPDLLARLDLAEDRLPDLLPATEAAGGLLADVAERTSLPAGVPVSPAVHDQYAAALGSCAVHPGDVMFGAGTAWVLLAVTETLGSPAAGAGWVCTHVVDGLYGQMLSLVNGGSSVTWVLDLLGVADLDRDALDEMIESVSAGSEGLQFVPLLASGGGAGLPRGTSGALSGLRLFHGRKHVLRAVVEGLAVELARYLRMMAAGGVAVERLLMSGGAAASRVTPQIVADAAGVPVTCTTEPDMSAFGAAVLAAALAEPGSDLVSLSEHMRPVTRTFEPGTNARLYRELTDAYIAALPGPDQESTS